jgi:hypothetical protein
LALIATTGRFSGLACPLQAPKTMRSRLLILTLIPLAVDCTDASRAPDLGATGSSAGGAAAGGTAGSAATSGSGGAAGSVGTGGASGSRTVDGGGASLDGGGASVDSGSFCKEALSDCSDLAQYYVFFPWHTDYCTLSRGIAETCAYCGGPGTSPCNRTFDVVTGPTYTFLDTYGFDAGTRLVYDASGTLLAVLSVGNGQWICSAGPPDLDTAVVTADPPPPGDPLAWSRMCMGLAPDAAVDGFDSPD